MIHYPDFKTAFTTHEACPFCKSFIQQGYTSIEDVNGETIVSFSFSGTKLVTDLHNKIIEYTTDSGLQNISAQHMGTAYIMTKQSTVSYEYVKVVGSCYECGCYSYTLQMRVNLKEGTIESIALNSEVFCIEQGKTLYEIKNNYASKYTKYDVFSNDLDPITLPLIPMDITNPIKTLERIKTLVIFS